jgi:Caspase domain
MGGAGLSTCSQLAIWAINAASMKDESVKMRGNRRGGWAAVAVVAAVALGAPAAAAETRRVAVVVGHNTGGATERPLRYAEEDAAKMADVLVELGEVAPENLFLVRGRPVEAVTEALRRATLAVQKARKDLDDRVVLTFFFSGHSDAGALQLGQTRLGYVELKKLLAATGAEVRLTIIDGCKSGSLVAAKGGRPGPAFEIGLADQLTSVGEATLTSSAADEASLESSEIRGSFFTHHLVSGLRGAADVSGDGRVTLSEAYEHAFNRTVVASAAAGGAPQHPNYEYQLSGGGELVLTRVGERTASLQLPAGFSRALVVNVLRDQVIAELSRDDVRLLAVAPGEYGVRLWRDGATWLGRVKAPARAVTRIEWAQLRGAVGQARQDKGMLPESRLVQPGRTGTVPGIRGGEPLPFPLTSSEEDAPLPAAAQALWDQMVLSVGDPLPSHQQLGTLSVSKATYIGTRRRQLTTEAFLRIAGRKDLASQIENRRGIRYLLVGGGAALAVGGVIYGYASQCDAEPGDPDFSSCADSSASGIFVGTFMVLGGMGALALGTLLDDNVPESHVLRGLADGYNRSLRTRLLTGQPLDGAAKTSSLRLSPVVGPSGGAFVLSGRF